MVRRPPGAKRTDTLFPETALVRARRTAGGKARTEGKGALDVKICQLVNLKRGGELVKMSKRSGTFVTLREVIEEVGKDVVRFIMLTRKNDATLDFDLVE